MVQNEAERCVSEPSLYPWPGVYTVGSTCSPQVGRGYVRQAYHQIKAGSDFTANCARLLKSMTAPRLGKRAMELIHHRPYRSHPSKGLHANTISTTAGHLTSTSLTALHANSINLMLSR